MVLGAPPKPDDNDEDEEEEEEYTLRVLSAWVNDEISTFDADILLQLREGGQN